MAYNVNTLFMKKQNGSDSIGILNTVDEFGIYVAESMPDMDPEEAKTEGDGQDWPDYDGLDVLDFERSYIGAFEVDIPFVCYADTPEECRKAYRSLFNYLTGRPYINKNGASRNPLGTMMMLYQPWVGYGRKDVRYKSTTDKEFWRDTTGYTIYTFTIKVEVCDPVSVVTLTETPDLVVDNSIDILGVDIDRVFYGSSYDIPEYIDRSQGNAKVTTTSSTKNVATQVGDMRRCHWIAVPIDSRYSVTAITDASNVSIAQYAQTRQIDGYNVTYVFSTEYIAGTTKFTLSR